MNIKRIVDHFVETFLTSKVDADLTSDSDPTSDDECELPLRPFSDYKNATIEKVQILLLLFREIIRFLTPIFRPVQGDLTKRVYMYIHQSKQWGFQTFSDASY